MPKPSVVELIVINAARSFASACASVEVAQTVLSQTVHAQFPPGFPVQIGGEQVVVKFWTASLFEFRGVKADGSQDIYTIFQADFLLGRDVTGIFAEEVRRFKRNKALAQALWEG